LGRIYVGQIDLRKAAIPPTKRGPYLADKNPSTPLPNLSLPTLLPNNILYPFPPPVKLFLT